MILHGPGPTAQPWPARLGAMAFALVLAAAGATRAESACAGLVPGADAPIRNLAYAAPEAGVPAAVLKLDLWPGAAPLPAPLVVFVHGGTWMHGGKYAGTPQQARAPRRRPPGISPRPWPSCGGRRRDAGSIRTASS